MSHSVPAGRHTRGTACLTMIGALALAACQDVAAPTIDGDAVVGEEQAPTEQVANAIPDEYIVIFKQDVADPGARANALVKEHGGNVRFTYTAAVKGFAARMSAQAAEALRNNPNVAYVEPDQPVDMSGGVQVGAPWGLDRIDQASSTLDGYYNYPSLGAGVNAYIIDTGIRRTHTQFGGRVVPAFDAIGDGYGPDGCQWHGTHVAGIVGGSTYGVAKGTALHSVRVTDCTGATVVSSVIAGVDWVTANHVAPAVGVLSLSTGLSSTLNYAVANSINSGVTYVVAAGNNGNSDACNYSPASNIDAITVAAITGQDAQTTYTNVGSCVDLYAPGTQIYGPVHTSDDAISLYTGTSQSAAFVAGAAVLYLEANPDASPAQVAQAIVAGATTGAVTNPSAATPNRILRIGGSGSTEPTTTPTTNTPPSAAFRVSCHKASCSFDASSSRDDAGVVNFTWSFGDGASESSGMPLATHVYSGRGSYSMTVTLTVKDAAGLTATAQKSISIRNNGK